MAEGEILRAKVDLETATAIASAMALREAVLGTAEDLGAMAQKVGAADKQLDALGASEKAAGTAADDAGRKVRALGDSAETAGEKVKGAGTKAKTMGDDVTAGSNKATGAMGPLETITHKVGAAAVSMVAGFAGLQGITAIIRELTENLEKVIEAKRKLGQEKLDVAQEVKSLVDNLGLALDPRGQQRSQAFLSTFVQQTGTTIPQAKEILSMAQASDFKVIDVDRPETDTQLPGFQAAARLGEYAGRAGLDARTAGESLKIARAAGVETPEQMDALLAKFEVAQQQTQISLPAEFFEGAVRFVAQQMSQGVTVDQALAEFASAATGKTSAPLAVNAAEQFQRTAMGLGEPRVKRLSEIAEEQGILTPEMIEAQAPRVRGGDAAEKAAESIEAARKAIRDRAEEEAIKARRGAEDLEVMRTEPLTGDPRKQAEQARRLARAEEDYTRDRADAAADMAAAQKKLAAAEAAEVQRVRDEAAMLAFRALPLAQKQTNLRTYLQGLPEERRAAAVAELADSEMALNVLQMTGEGGASKFAGAQSAIQGATPERLRELNERFRTSTVGQQNRADASKLLEGVKIAPQGAEFANIVEDAAKRDIELLRQAGSGGAGFFTAFGDAASGDWTKLTGGAPAPPVGAERTLEQRREDYERRLARAGVDIRERPQRAEAVLREDLIRGEGFKVAPPRPGSLDTTNTSETALEARRIAVQTQQRFALAWQQMDEGMREQYLERAMKLWADLEALPKKGGVPVLGYVFGENLMPGVAGPEAMKKQAQEVAQKAGALLQDISQKALDEGKTPPLGTEEYRVPTDVAAAFKAAGVEPPDFGPAPEPPTKPTTRPAGPTTQPTAPGVPTVPTHSNERPSPGQEYEAAVAANGGKLVEEAGFGARSWAHSPPDFGPGVNVPEGWVIDPATGRLGPPVDLAAPTTRPSTRPSEEELTAEEQRAIDLAAAGPQALGEPLTAEQFTMAMLEALRQHSAAGGAVEKRMSVRVELGESFGYPPDLTA